MKTAPNINDHVAFRGDPATGPLTGRVTDIHPPSDRVAPPQGFDPHLTTVSIEVDLVPNRWPWGDHVTTFVAPCAAIDPIDGTVAA